jgi:putative PEP-CTERM system histidine kinase
MAAALGGAGAVAQGVAGGAEALRPLVWTLMLLALMRDGVSAVRPGPPMAAEPDTAPRIRGRFPYAAPALAVALALASLASSVAHGAAGAHSGVPDLLAAIFALVCVEQVYLNTDAAHRWAIKPLCLALAAAFSFDIVLIADTLRTGTADAGWWAARGFAHALLVPLVAIAAARNRNWQLQIKLSRDLVFHSATLIGSVGFVLVFAALGWAARVAGPDWAGVVQALLPFCAAVAAAAMLCSDSLRARLRVWVAKHFFSYRYDYREEWLRLTRIVSAPDAGDADALGERALRALCDLVDSPGGTLWVQAADGDFLRDAHLGGNRPGPIGTDEPLLAWLRARAWIVDVDEWRRSAQRYDGLALPAQIADDPCAWLVVPLLGQDSLVGVVVLARPSTQAAVDWEVRDVLKAAGRQVAGYLALREAGERLAQAGRFDSFNRMSAFVVHDLKNLVAQLSLLLRNAARHQADPDFQRDMLATVENVVDRMQGLTRQLGGNTRAQPRRAEVPIAATLEAAVGARRGQRPAPVMTPLDAGLHGRSVLADPQRLERVFGHLLQNAVEATPPDGHVGVRAWREADEAIVEVSDTGHGMSESFVETRLFRPFASTKGHGLGLGTFECREYLREVGGRVDVRTAPGAGTTVTVRLPLVPARAAALLEE